MPSINDNIVLFFNLQKSMVVPHEIYFEIFFGKNQWLCPMKFILKFSSVIELEWQNLTKSFYFTTGNGAANLASRWRIKGIPVRRPPMDALLV